MRHRNTAVKHKDDIRLPLHAQKKQVLNTKPHDYTGCELLFVDRGLRTALGQGVSIKENGKLTEDNKWD
jgi:hypothetical protein